MKCYQGIKKVHILVERVQNGVRLDVCESTKKGIN